MINHFFYKLIINCRLYLAHTCSISDPKNYWIALVTRNKTLLRLRSYGENLSQVERSLAYPSYPGRAMAMTVSYSSLQNLTNWLREKQNVGLAERLTHLTGNLVPREKPWGRGCLTGWPFSDDKVTLLAEPARSKRDHQNMHERCCKLLAGANGSNINARLSWLGLERRVTLFQWVTFLLNVA